MQDEGARGRTPAPPAALTLLLLAGILAVAVLVRLREFLGVASLPAEDPYTHVVFAKQFLEYGYFAESFHLGTTLYPPGFHALAVIVAGVSGLELMTLARAVPIVLSVVSVLGVFALALRLAGPAAGLGAAFLVAVIPEHAFRTALFAPALVDLALLPALLLVAHVAFVDADTSRAGRVSAVVFAGLMVLALSHTHPWVVPIVAAIMAVAASIPLARGRIERADMLRAVGAALFAVVAVALASVVRWDHGNTGFTSFAADVPLLAPLASLSLSPPLLFPVLVFILAPFALGGVGAAVAVGVVAARLPRVARALMGALLGVAALAGVVFLSGLQQTDVRLVRLLGVVPAALALLGVGIAFVRPTALGDWGLAVGVVLFPLGVVTVFHDMFDAQHWPARTVLYLTIGVALLAAVGIDHATREAMRFASAGRARAWVAPSATFAVVMLLATAVAAAPPKPSTWYRLYPEPQYEGFEQAARYLDAQPDARVVVASWQPALVLKAIAEPNQVRYLPDFFRDPQTRDAFLVKREGAPTFIVVDRFVIERASRGGIHLEFLDGDDYVLVHQADAGAYRLYLHGGRG